MPIASAGLRAQNNGRLQNSEPAAALPWETARWQAALRGQVQPDADMLRSVGLYFGLGARHVQAGYALFRESDRNKDGVLEVEEVRQVLGGGGDIDAGLLAATMKEYDRDTDGVISFPEFLSLFATVSRLADNAPSGVGSIDVNAPGDAEIQELLMNIKARADLERHAKEETAALYQVPRSAVTNLLDRELSEAAACMELPIALVLFIVFTIAVLSHERIYVLHGIQHAIAFDITENANFAFAGDVPFENGRMGFKTVYDVNSIPDFWSWLSMGLVPLLWPEAWDVSEPRTNVLAACTRPAEAIAGWSSRWSWPSDAYRGMVDDLPPDLGDQACPESAPGGMPEEFFGTAKPNMYLYFNRVVGGVRLRQERSVAGPCEVPEDLLDQSFHAPCHPGQYWLQPDLHSLFYFDDRTPSEGRFEGRTAVLRTGLPQVEVRTRIKALEEEEAWATPAAQRLEVSFVTYNAIVDTLTITYVSFYMTHAGQIWKIIQPNTVSLTPYRHWSHYFWDIVWALINLKIVISESREVAASMKFHGIVQGYWNYISFWNVVDWIGCLYSFMIIALWIKYCLILGEVAVFLKTSNLDVVGSWDNEADVMDVFARMDGLAYYAHSMRRVLCVYPFIMVLRFFKSFHAQPRLSLVTQTLVDSWLDIVHFGVVFMSVFVVYCISGMVLFGQEILEFASVDRALITCWRLLLGDFDFDSLFNIGRFESIVWFWSFTSLVGLVMINMFIALVMDTYMAVKSALDEGGGAEQLWGQAYEIWARHQQVKKGLHVPMQKVLQKVMSDEPDIMTLEKLKREVVGLHDHQAMEILRDARQRQDAESAKLDDSSWLKVLIISKRQEGVNLGIEKLAELFQLMVSGQAREPAAPAAPRSVSTASAAAGPRSRIESGAEGQGPREASISVQPPLLPGLPGAADAAAAHMRPEEAMRVVQGAADAIARAAEERLKCELTAQRALLQSAEEVQKEIHAKMMRLDEKLGTVDRLLEQGRRQRQSTAEALKRARQAVRPEGNFGAGCTKFEMAAPLPIAPEAP